jgi:hypothetical protein
VIHAPFDPESLDGEQKAWFDDWVERAETARDQMIGAWKPGDVPLPTLTKAHETLWQELRDWMVEHVFHWKCGYCEKDMERQCRDAEHYRPKKPVAGGPPDHPGYFWLALAWENIVPSCEFCNRRKGKRSQFPVEEELAMPGDPLQTSSELDALERPLLLHPVRDEHLAGDLRFGFGGTVAGASPRGKQTVRVFHLDDDELLRPRMRARRDVKRKFLLKLIDREDDVDGPDTDHIPGDLRHEMDDARLARLPYTAARRAMLADLVDQGSKAKP